MMTPRVVRPVVSLDRDHSLQKARRRRRRRPHTTPCLVVVASYLLLLALSAVCCRGWRLGGQHHFGGVPLARLSPRSDGRRRGRRARRVRATVERPAPSSSEPSRGEGGNDDNTGHGGGFLPTGFGSLISDLYFPPDAQKRGAAATKNGVSQKVTPVDATLDDAATTTETLLDNTRHTSHHHHRASFCGMIAPLEEDGAENRRPHPKKPGVAALNPLPAQNNNNNGQGHEDESTKNVAVVVEEPRNTRQTTTNPVGRYAQYVGELWRANETETAREGILKTRREKVAKRRLAERAKTGVLCGFIFTAWIFSSGLLYTVGMGLLSIVAQLEYFRVAIAGGAAPARRIVACSSVAMLLSACYAPGLHELVFPLAGTWVMLWFLLMRPNCSSIHDISTTLLGLFYTAYLPSWWVRLRCAPVWATTTVAMPGGPDYLAASCAPAVAPILGPSLAPALTGLLLAPNAVAATAVWWTCLGVAVSDIGAYFGGKKFGKRSLKSVGLGAAAKASPNKTIEGALSGFAASALTLGVAAFVMHWPLPALTGPLFGLCVSMTALVGDLTASMLKRDGQVKDFGDLLPGHGGLLDRLDGFIFVAPIAFVLLPKLLLTPAV